MLIQAMYEFTSLLLKADPDGMKRISLRRGLMLDDVFSSQSMIVVIEKGKLEVVCHSGALANILHDGEIYGVQNLYLDSPLASVLCAGSDVDLILIPKETVRSLIDSDRDLAHAYCQMLNERIGFLVSRVSLLGIKSNRKRLAAWLLMEGQRSFSSREELADYLALGKSALFRELARLEELGAVEYSARDIAVLDRTILEEVLRE